MTALFNKNYELFYSTVAFLVSYYKNERALENYEKEIEKCILENDERTLAFVKKAYADRRRRLESDFEAFEANKEYLKSKGEEHMVKTLAHLSILIQT